MHTYPVILTEPDQPEAHGEHAGVDEDCDGILGIFELRLLVGREAFGYQPQNRRRAEWIDGHCFWLLLVEMVWLLVMSGGLLWGR